MTAIEQADQLAAQAIQILLTARQEIDARLQQLGHGEGQIKKRRGRPPLPKATSPAENIIE